MKGLVEQLEFHCAWKDLSSLQIWDGVSNCCVNSFIEAHNKEPVRWVCPGSCLPVDSSHKAALASLPLESTYCDREINMFSALPGYLSQTF